MLKPLDRALKELKPSVDEMEQWEVEKSLGVLIEGIQERYYKAAGLEWTAKVLREEADRMAETLALYRQHLGLPLTPIPQKGAKQDETLYQTTPEGRMPASVSPRELRGE